MIFAKEVAMKNKEDLQKELSALKEQMEKAKKQNKQLDEANGKLQDEVDSLWAMMDEMTKSDVENWAHLLDTLQKDTVVKALMVTKNKAEA